MKVSTKAFGIYCDRIIKDTNEICTNIQHDNVRKESARMVFGTVQIANSDSTRWIPLQNFIVEEGGGGGEESVDNNVEYLVYNFESGNDDGDTVSTEPSSVSSPFLFPYVDLKSIDLSISGVLQESNILSPAMFTVDDEKEQIHCLYAPWGGRLDSVNPAATVFVSISNFNGPFETVKELVTTNQISVNFQFLGMHNAETGLPALFGGGGLDFSSLDGAICTLTKLMIRKTEGITNILSCLDLNNNNEELLSTMEEEDMKDNLLHLRGVDPWNKELATVVDKYSRLITRKSYLESCLDVFQSFQVTYPGQDSSSSTVLKLNLRDGKLKPLIGGRGDLEETNSPPTVAWTLEVPFGEIEDCTSSSWWTIPVSSIRMLQFTCGNIAANIPGRAAHIQQPVITADNFLIVKFSKYITAVFGFDDTWNGIDVNAYQGGPYIYIMHQIMGAVGGDIPEQYRNATMKMIWIQIRTESILTQLDALGINVNEEEEVE